MFNIGTVLFILSILFCDFHAVSGASETAPGKLAHMAIYQDKFRIILNFFSFTFTFTFYFYIIGHLEAL